MTQVINKSAEVNSYYFSKRGSFKSFPKEITVDQTRYAFLDGLQFLVQRGQDVIRLFDMTDGVKTYRLRQHQGVWTLVSAQS